MNHCETIWETRPLRNQNFVRICRRRIGLIICWALYCWVQTLGRDFFYPAVVCLNTINRSKVFAQQVINTQRKKFFVLQVCFPLKVTAAPKHPKMRLQLILGVSMQKLLLHCQFFLRAAILFSDLLKVVCVFTFDSTDAGHIGRPTWSGERAQ